MAAGVVAVEVADEEEAVGVGRWWSTVAVQELAHSSSNATRLSPALEKMTRVPALQPGRTC